METPVLLQESLPDGVNINFALIASVIYIFYYLLIEIPGIAGLISAAIVYLGYWGASVVVRDHPGCWKPALVLHIAAWVGQLYGHKVHEKRSPALLDNLPQALLMAPLFVVIEVLHKLFGYRRKFIRECMTKAQCNIEEFRKSKAK
jgi:uncharacterized membrane protein YGL010W